MTGLNRRWCAELAERAEDARDVGDFRGEALQVVRSQVGFDTVRWQASTRGIEAAYTDTDRDSDGAIGRAADRLVKGSSRFSAYFERLYTRAMRCGGCAVDTDVSTQEERRTEPLWVEVVRPIGITTSLVCVARFRGAPTSRLGLHRHGRSTRFNAANVDVMRDLLPALGLVEMAFRACPEVDSPDTRSTSSRFSELTPRERQVAALLARGLQNKEIARLLGTSPSTVRNQAIRIYAKMGVENRTQLAASMRGP